MNQERLLTPEEIQIVLLQAADYGRYLDLKNLMWMHTAWQDVVFLTPLNKLIFIWGNEHTGFCHINDRHCFYQNQLYWKDGKPENPSMFKRNTIPYGDYRDIAEELFLNGIKNEKKRPLFDNYKGKFKHNNGDELDYFLVTYEGTKIVHTLYPKKKLGNINYPKGFLWHRGEVVVNQSLFKDGYKFEVRIPYIDSEGTKRYSILIEFINGIENVYFQVHIPAEKKTGTTQAIFSRPTEILQDENALRNYFQYADIPLLENHILGLHKQHTQK